MDFSLNDDQLAVAGELDKLAERFATSPVDFHGFALVSEELDQSLAESGFFDLAAVPELGPLTAAMAAERLARLPFTAEIGLSMLVLPVLQEALGELPRPLAIIDKDKPGRFVAGCKTLLIIDGDSIAIAHPEPTDTQAIEGSIYAYPMAELKADIASTIASTPLDAELAQAVRDASRVSLAAEIAGLMRAGIDAIVEHISVRKQFGRPLGTFQALRHRIAECEVLARGVKHLALSAAWSGQGDDAALAAFHARDSANKIIYDLHQMSGAMGMTLEMDLHLWTYRIKALLSVLGGRCADALAFDGSGGFENAPFGD